MPVSTDDHNALQLYTKHSKYKYEMFSALKYSFRLMIKKKTQYLNQLAYLKSFVLGNT